MTPFVFDTLSASKRLREAGMAEGVAEAVVSVFQHAAEMPDISHLATKDDLDALRGATKADLDALRLATKTDLETTKLEIRSDLEATKLEIKSELNAVKQAMATKADLLQYATKSDLEPYATKDLVEFAKMELKRDILASEARVRETIRLQGWALMGGVGVLLAVFGGMGRLLG